MSKKRPTQRTLEHLRKEGCLVDVVERFIKVPKHPGGGIRRDLFGIIDILAIRDGKMVGIQTTSGSNHSAHIKKVLDDPELQGNVAQWLGIGAIYEIWSWTSKKGKWTVRKDAMRVAA